MESVPSFVTHGPRACELLYKSADSGRFLAKIFKNGPRVVYTKTIVENSGCSRVILIFEGQIARVSIVSSQPRDFSRDSWKSFRKMA